MKIILNPNGFYNTIFNMLVSFLLLSKLGFSFITNKKVIKRNSLLKNSLNTLFVNNNNNLYNNKYTNTARYVNKEFDYGIGENFDKAPSDWSKVPYPNNLPDWFDKSEHHIVSDEELEYFRVDKEGPDHHRIQMSKDAHHVKQVPRLRHGMFYKKLGNSNLIVSEVCLGTMTWGQQNTKEEAFQQLDYAFDEYGVNFIDTAELYPIPAMSETQGRTERYIGEWLKNREREKVILATKVTGFSDRLTWMRKNGGSTRVSKKQIIEAVDNSLKRLGTDYIDLLQIHWPDRYVPLFGLGFYDRSSERESISFEEQLDAMDILVKQGKVREIGLSNETPFGLTNFLNTAKEKGLPKVVSLQNCYNLFCRNDVETGLLEPMSPHNGNVGLLAYSPLAGGALTGKYRDTGNMPQDGRLTLFPGYMARYMESQCRKVLKEIDDIGEEEGFTATELALAWVYSRDFVTSTIIGATNLKQLDENLNALNIPMYPALVNKLNDLFLRYRDPAKVVASIGSEDDEDQDEDDPYADEPESSVNN